MRAESAQQMRDILTTGENKNQLTQMWILKQEVENQLAKVDKLNRSNLLNYRTYNKKCNRVPCRLNYSRGSPNIHQILKKRQKILEHSDSLKLAFQNIPEVAFRKYKNLKDILHVVHKKHKIFLFFRNNTYVSRVVKKMCYF